LIQMTRKRRADDATYTCGTAMSVYQRAWLTVFAILTAIGGAVVLIISPALTALLFIAFAVVGLVFMLPDAGQHGKLHGRHRARQVVTGSLIVGATAPACLGLALTRRLGTRVRVVRAGVVTRPAGSRTSSTEHGGAVSGLVRELPGPT
jgi:hypothetical protein